FHTTAGRGLRRINDPRTAPNDAAGKNAKPESRNSKHKRDDRCYCALRKTAEEEARKFEEHVTEDATKADPHRPALRHHKATDNGREQQCSTKPCKTAFCNAPDTAARYQQQRPDSKRKQGWNARQTEKLHGNIREHGSRITKRIRDQIVGRMAETRIGHIPCCQR